MSQSDLNTDFYISAYVRRDLHFNQIALCLLLSRYHTGFFFLHKLHRIFKVRLSGFTKCVQVRYLQDIVNMLVQVLK